MSEWTRACYLCDVDRIRDMLETEGTIILNRRDEGFAMVKALTGHKVPKLKPARIN